MSNICIILSFFSFFLSCDFLSLSSSTVGYGDVSAGTALEMAFAMFAMGIGVVWTGMTVASVTQALAELNMKTQLVSQKQKKVSRYLRVSKLPPDVYQEVEGFFRGGKDTDRLLQFEMTQQLLCQEYSSLLDEMPVKLRSKVIICMRQSLLSKLPFLNGADRGFVMAFLLCARLKSVAPGSLICTEGMPSSGIFVVVEGHVAAYHSGTHVAVAQCGEIFGLVESVNSLCYMLTLKPRVDSAVLLVDGVQLKRLFVSYPDAAQELLQTNEKLLGRIIPESPSSLVRRNSKTFIKEFQPGETIIQQGDLGEEAYNILNGEVRVDVQMANGYIKTVATLKAGETFGEIAQNATNRRRTATCIAKDVVILEVISVKKYDDLNVGLEGIQIDELVTDESDDDDDEEKQQVEDVDTKAVIASSMHTIHTCNINECELLAVKKELQSQRVMLTKINKMLNKILNSKSSGT